VHQVLGADHPDTLTTRNSVAAWIGECGDSTKARGLLELLLPDQVRVLGSDHPDTLNTRNSVAVSVVIRLGRLRCSSCCFRIR
jgi:hypothetical protein